MVGQHIYTRCKIEHFSTGRNATPGSQTAALHGIELSRRDVQETIEPHCTLSDAAINQLALLGSSKYVLRINHLESTRLLVTRTGCIDDRLTGRGNALYSYSHILDGGDFTRLWETPEHLMNDAAFEPYAAVAERALADPDQRVRINPAFSLLAPFEAEPVPGDIFERCGFTEDSFLQYIAGLLNACGNSERLLLVLPQAVQESWLNQQGREMEQLLCATLRLLPLPLRSQLNITLPAHADAEFLRRLKGKQLAFVLSSSASVLAELSNAFPMLDLDSDAHTNIEISAARPLASYLWDNRHDRAALDRFSAFLNEFCGEALARIPLNAAVLGDIFRAFENRSFADTESASAVLISVSRLFSGAIARFHLRTAEAMTKNSLQALMAAAPSAMTEELQWMLISLLNKEPPNTAFYSSGCLLAAQTIRANHAETPFINAFAELSLKIDAAAQSCDDLLAEAALAPEALTNNLIDLAAALCCRSSALAQSALPATARTLLENAVEFYARRSDWSALLRLSDRLSMHLADAELSTQNRKLICEILFLLSFQTAAPDAAAQAQQLLSAEDERLFLAEPRGDEASVRTYSRCFVDTFETALRSESISADNLLRCFLLSATLGSSFVERIKPLFSQALAKSSAAPEDLINAELNAARRLMPLYPAESIQHALLMCQTEIFRHFGNKPSKEQYEMLLSLLSPCTVKGVEVLLLHLNTLPETAQEEAAKLVRANEELLYSVFVGTLANPQRACFSARFEPLLDVSAAGRCKVLQAAIRAQTPVEVVRNWYKKAWKAAVKDGSTPGAAPDTAAQLALLKQELAQLNALTAAPIFDAAYDELSSWLLGGLRDLCRMSAADIRRLLDLTNANPKLAQSQDLGARLNIISQVDTLQTPVNATVFMQILGTALQNQSAIMLAEKRLKYRHEHLSYELPEDGVCRYCLLQTMLTGTARKEYLFNVRGYLSQLNGITGNEDSVNDCMDLLNLLQWLAADRSPHEFIDPYSRQILEACDAFFKDSLRYNPSLRRDKALRQAVEDLPDEFYRSIKTRFLAKGGSHAAGISISLTPVTIIVGALLNLSALLVGGVLCWLLLFVLPFALPIAGGLLLVLLTLIVVLTRTLRRS